MAQHLTERLAAGAPPRTDDADQSFLRWAGYSGLLASLAFLITVIVANVSGVAPPSGPSEIVGFLQDTARVAWSSYTYGIAGIVLTVLYVPMAVGVHRLLGGSPAAWFGSAAVVIGLAVLFPAYVSSMLAPAGLASAASDVGGAGAAALFVLYTYTSAAAAVLFAVGSVLSLAFGPLLWGAEWLRSRDASRWLGWAGVITGVAGMVWFAGNVANPVLIPIVVVNVLVSLVFFTGISLVLVAAGRSGR